MNTAIMKLDIASPIGSLDSYTYYVNQIPMLKPEEEVDLATRFHQQSDLAAARQLVLAHLRFVVKIARGYSGYGLALADLIQEGNIGLMKAVKRFDPSLGVRLVTFAVHWIKAEMHEFIIKNWRIVKIATTKAQRKLFFNLRRIKQRLGWFTQDEIADVAKELGVEQSVVTEMELRMNAHHDISLDLSNDEDETAENYSPLLYLTDNKNPADDLETIDWQEQNQERLAYALTTLDQRSLAILQDRWLAEKKATLHELADKYNISAERVRQLEANAMKKLKEMILVGQEDH
jgi:RNA polymerase sigma-32 factor